MKKLIFSIIFITATTLSYSQITLEGKIYEALLSVVEVDGVIEGGWSAIPFVGIDGVIVKGIPEDMGVGGRYSHYCILIFEKDSVSISNREKAQGDIFHCPEYDIQGNEYDTTFPPKKRFYRVRNKTIQIENFTIKHSEPQKMFILKVEDDGQKLIAEEKTYIYPIEFKFKGLVQGYTNNIKSK